MNQISGQTANIEAIYPLSPLQEGFLFHSLYAPHTGVYFEQLVFGLDGPLDAAALRRAWQAVVQRHPILRTLFVWEGRERPLQVVRREVELPWQQFDWRGLPPAEQPARLAALLQADRERGFDLGQAPLLRLSLIRLGEQQYQVVWSHHHILMDGWSVMQVLGEVFACYAAYSAGDEPRLASVRPYRDYITWLQQQRADGMEAFWRASLRGLAAPTALGIDRPAPDSAPAHAADYHDRDFWLPAPATAALQRLARERQLTLNTVMQGVWALLLGCYSGQGDVLFGATVAGRTTELLGIESMVGLFINTLPVRVRIDPRQRLGAWLSEIQAQQIEARQYEHSPLVRVQGWSEIGQTMPLFESLLVFENYPSQHGERSVGGGMRLHSMQSFEVSSYPLTLVVVPGDRMQIRVIYDSRRFDAERIDALGSHLLAVCEGVAAAPDRTLGEVPTLGAAERRRVVELWNATASPYDRSATIPELFSAQAARTPQAPALEFAGRQWSYAELDARSSRLAHLLRQQGVGADSPVAVCLERSPDLVVALLAVLKAGGAYLPLDPAYPAARLAWMLEDARAPVLIAQPDLAARLPPGPAAVLLLDALAAELEQFPATPPPCPATPDSLAYLSYTSGSTGTPKGVAVPHRAVVRLAQGRTYATFTPADRFLLLAPVAFDASTLELWCSLLNGACLVVAPPGPLDLDQLAALLREARISTLWLTAGLFHQLVAHDAQALAGVRQLLAGGDVLAPDAVRATLALRGGLPLINGYGPTENTTFTCCHVLTDPAEVAGPVPIGRPIPQTQVYVLDPQMRPVPVGVVGELYTGGDGLARGYLGRPDLTAERFVPNPFGVGGAGDWGLGAGEENGEPRTENHKPVAEKAELKTQNSKLKTHSPRLYRTGDLVRWRPDGTLEFIGRRDGQIKLRGFRIELDEIAAALRQHPAVRDTAVLLRGGESGAPGEQRLVAYVVPEQEPRTKNQEPDVGAVELKTQHSELRTYLRERLPEYMVPALFVSLPRLPLNPNGKVDRAALPDPDAAALVDDAYLAPRDPVEQALAMIWQQLLGVERIGVAHNFFELGGHSLLATQLASWLRTAFQVEIALRDLFEQATIEELAPLLRAREAAPGKTLRIAQVLIQFEGMSLADVKKALEVARLRSGSRHKEPARSQAVTVP
ncbi:MAG TPA: amino acid adenylation domain-containing protein [Roseiflexaceae bacterium]|nr:amino acid adenylation domain-containing protein [Roseiflexaceae bacterium]